MDVKSEAKRNSVSSSPICYALRHDISLLELMWTIDNVKMPCSVEPAAQNQYNIDNAHLEGAVYT